jgi:2'-5' RNA ligase
MALSVVSYPLLGEAVFEWIDSMRNVYPELEHDPIPPHITFIFPTGHIHEDTLIDHVEVIAQSFALIPFFIRYAMPVWDAISERGYVFLPPDEGFSDISLLHDALYSGPLDPLLRLDVPYIPHLTLGYIDDMNYVKRVCDDINANAFEIEGMIQKLDVLFIGDTIEIIASIQL